MEEKEISFIIRKHPRAKRMHLIVHGDGCVVVSGPMRMTERGARRFIAEKQTWIHKQLAYFAARKLPVIPPGKEKADYKAKKEFARRLVSRRIQELNRFYNFSVGKISIRNQKTRWGSCSENGDLSFNYKLIYLPSEVLDYLLVHELCHIEEHNHSPAFWKLIERAIPDYKKFRKQLKKFSVALS